MESGRSHGFAERQPGRGIATIALVAALFAFDLFFSGRRPHVVEFREAVAWSILYVGVAVGFGVALGTAAGWDYGAEYFAGYLVEKASRSTTSSSSW